MGVVIPVAFDFTCPQCWIGFLQAQRLRAEFGVEIDWLPYELWPEELPWPEPRPAIPEPPGKPKIPSRFELQLRADGIEMPPAMGSRPKRMRAHYPHEAAAFLKVKEPERLEHFIGAAFRAYWERGERIGDLDVVLELAGDGDELREALECRAYRDQVVHYDAAAFASGVWNVPTFWIGGERFAEQPYSVLAEAVARDERGETRDDLRTIYADLVFPASPSGRPYTYINMVATIDGKILTGERDEHVVDLGSKVDHELMRRIEVSADAVMVGATTLRASKKSWNPGAAKRIVVTRSGNLDLDHCFFSGDAYVAVPDDAKLDEDRLRRSATLQADEDRLRRSATLQADEDRLRRSATLQSDEDRLRRSATLQADEDRLRRSATLQVLRAGRGDVDLNDLVRQLKGMGVERLLVMGGSTLNAQLLKLGLVDELFLTVAPKVKLGKDVPTYADGEPLARGEIQDYALIEEHRVGDELFLRYRRKL